MVNLHLEVIHFFEIEVILLEPQNDTQKLAVLCAQLADDKLAKDIFVLDLKEIESSPADYFVMCSCDSPPQVQAITDLILQNCVDYKLAKPKMEGFEAGEWVILDFFDVVVHVMLNSCRTFYKIERLWGDGQFYTVSEDGQLNEITTNSVFEIYEATGVI